jgi:hypothetical protein
MNVTKPLASLLEKEKVAFDVGAYRDAPPGLRIWCGASVDTKDIEALTPWLDFAYATAKDDLAKAKPFPKGLRLGPHLGDNHDSLAQPKQQNVCKRPHLC